MAGLVLIMMMMATCPCSSQSVEGVPVSAWGGWTTEWPTLSQTNEPFDISTEKLTLVRYKNFVSQADPYYSHEFPDRFYEQKRNRLGKLKAGVRVHCFCNLTVRGHGPGVTVYSLPKEGIFFLYTGCAMDHLDGMVGPFRGDPATELPKAAVAGGRGRVIDLGPPRPTPPPN